MTRDLKTSLDSIFAYLHSCGLSIADRGRAGIRRPDVDVKFQSLGLPPPADLSLLYSLCDGTTTVEGDKLGGIQFFPGFYWMSLDEAIQVYHSISGDARWNRWWFPVFANGGGDFYAVICDSNSPYFGEVVGFVVGDDDQQIVEFKSVSAMF